MLRALPPIALAAAALLGVATGGRAQPTPAQPEPAAKADEPPTGFDHIGHEGKVAVAGADPIACTRCHDVAASGAITNTPGHDACFDACHGGPPPRRTGRPRARPYSIDPSLHRVCGSCHSPSLLERVDAGSREKLAVTYPPYTIEPDYSITFPHDRHREPASDIGGCAACHATPPDAGEPAPPAPAAHSRCAPCHTREGDAEPTMSDCTSCHLAAFGPATTPHLVTGGFPVTARFSHRAHLRRGGKDLTCERCHQAAARAAGDQIPAPPTDACEGCHDGTTAFSTLTPDCRRCHAQPAERTRRPQIPDVHYSHEAHAARGLALPCRACHRPEGAPGELAPVTHEPCSDAGCHASQFSDPKPTICAACHVGSEPWRELHAEPPEVAITEFGSRFDHRAHLAHPPAGEDEVDCTRCHRIDPTSGRTRVEPDHDACAGEACHDPGGATPTLGSCDDCHRTGLLASRRQARRSARFTVRPRFDHRPHRTDAAGAPLACANCHDGVTTSDQIAAIPTPGKPACAPCHDGDTAFKMTGHGCKRCHGK